jgi:hypothetical protein
MNIVVKNGNISEEEKQAYVQYVKEKNPTSNITDLIISLDGDYVNLDYKTESTPFTRTRRITGYLTNMDRANNAKRSEIEDRVKHNV